MIDPESDLSLAETAIQNQSHKLRRYGRNMIYLAAVDLVAVANLVTSVALNGLDRWRETLSEPRNILLLGLVAASGLAELALYNRYIGITKEISYRREMLERKDGLDRENNAKDLEVKLSETSREKIDGFATRFGFDPGSPVVQSIELEASRLMKDGWSLLDVGKVRQTYIRE